jgi:PKD repeat protein
LIRKAISVIMLTLLSISTVCILMARLPVAKTSPSTVLSVDPTSIIEPALGVDSIFFVNITVADVQNLAGFQFILSYDTSVLTAVDYGFYPPLDDAYFCKINDAEGHVDLTSTLHIEDWGTGGLTTIDPTPVAWIEFVVDDRGMSVLHLHGPSDGSLLGNPKGEPIPHLDVDGFFDNRQSGAPTAAFIYSPINPYVGVTVTFDASISYDPDGSIVSYFWDLGDGATESGMIVTHAYAVAGTFSVLLTVTDNDALIDTATSTITVPSMPMHDIAVTAISVHPTEVLQGETVTINVTAQNKGDFTETFDVTVYYDNTAISTMTVEDLAPSAEIAAVLLWDTSGVAGGAYAMKAAASPVTGEVNTANNVLVDDLVTVAEALSVKLSGEFDYSRMEAVQIRVATLVRNALTMEPVSNALVTVEIYDPAGNLWVSAQMQEKIGASGIYEWPSVGTIAQLKLSKGVYLVRSGASFQGGPTAYDISLFHIDPPVEDTTSVTPLLLYAVTIFIAAGATIGIALLRRHKRRQLTSQ